MLVYDKSIFNTSKRKLDKNGYLRVDMCNITKAAVNPYLGREIPDSESFGLEPEKIYYVLRPAEELKKAVESFNNLPLLSRHIEVDVENVPKKDIVGSLGDKASFEYPYIQNSLIVYDKKDIDLALKGEKKELSCGYRYTPVKQSGVFEGQPYDFVMTDIIGNHVAIVKEGRAGHDVMIADSNETIKDKIMKLFKKEVVMDEFKEADHPRDKDGKFTKAGSEKKESSKETDVKSLYNKERENYLNSEDYELFKKANQGSARATSGLQYRNIKMTDWSKYDIEETLKDVEYTTGGKLDDFDKDHIKDLAREKVQYEWLQKEAKKETTNDAIPDEQEKPEKAGELALTKGETEMGENKEVLAKDKCAKDKDIDKRSLIDEIGGMLKDKVDEELWRTIIGKVEKIAYNDSETGANDKDLEDKEEKVEEKTEEKSEKLEEKAKEKEEMAKDEKLAMDIDAIKEQARQEVMADFKARETARKEVRSFVGDVNVMSFDSAEEIYKFACEKAGLNLSGIASYKDVFVGLSASKGKRLALDASPNSGSDEECFKGIRVL